MPIETPPPITPVPTPVPQRGDRATFSDRVDNFVTWLEDAPPEFEAVADNVENNATMAQTFATNAATSASAAAGSASAAAASATNSATSASAAAGSASAAATSATNAATSESNAAASAAAAAAMAAAFTGTSSTSLTIGTGNKSFTTQTNEQYSAGITMTAVSAANVANFMAGQVVSYNPGTGALVINVTVTGGSGTFADWNLSLAGVQGPTGPQGPAGNLNGGNLTGALNELKAANIAAAATTDVWSITGNSATLTGTTTITSFGTAPQAGSKRTLIAAAATPITNGANLILPGSANYTCAVGDRLEIYAETTTQHRVSIWKQDGTPVVGSGISTVGATVTANTTLTAASAQYQFTQMAAAGRSITLPDATTMPSVGSPKFLIDNSQGAYPAGIRNSAGTLIMAVGAGGTGYVSLKDKSTAAGVWSVTGYKLEPGLVSIDGVSTAIQTVTASSSLSPVFVALDDNVSIHFLAANNGVNWYAVVVDHTGKVLSTPVLVDGSSNSRTPVQAFKISATQAILFYGTTGGSHYAVVLTLTGSSPSYSLSVGTAANINQVYAANPWGGENFRNDPKIAQLTSTLYIVGLINAGNAIARAISVSGSTVTIGAESATFSGLTAAITQTVYPLTATTALFITKNGAGPYTNNATVVSVSGTTCTPGTPAAVTSVQSDSNAPAHSVKLSATKAIVMDNNGLANSLNANSISISGTTVTIGTFQQVEASGVTPAQANYSSNGAGRYNAHLWRIDDDNAGAWYVGSSVFSAGSRVRRINHTGAGVSVGNPISNSVQSAASNAGVGAMLPQSTTEFLALREQLAATAGVGLSLLPSRFDGTTNTFPTGIAENVREVLQQTPAQFPMGKTSNGDYGLLAVGTDNVIGSAKLVIARSNGIAVDLRGAISLPELSYLDGIAIGANQSPAPLANVAPNRFVLLGMQGIGTDQNSTSRRQRILSVELAA